MPAGKVVDHTEVRRWFEQGKTYPEMVELYLSKYNVETTPTMWSNYARRHGIKRRAVWDEELVPWRVRPEHRNKGAYLLLTQEARRRAGRKISPEYERRLASWKKKLAETGTVVHYDPDVEPYFHAVPAREGVDTDLVRTPDRVSRRAPTD